MTTRIVLLAASAFGAMTMAVPASPAAASPAGPVRAGHAVVTAAGRTAPAVGVRPDSKPSAMAGYVAWDGTSTGDAFNTAGGPVTVTHLSTGTYAVVFGKLGFSGGNAQVTALEEDPTCSVDGWTPASGDLNVRIDCFDSHGAAADAAFAVIVTKPRSRPSGVLDYDLIGFPTGSYVLAGPHHRATLHQFQYNSSGKTSAVKHLATGRYLVAMQGPPPSHTGTVKVSAYGATAGDCQLAKWSSTRAGQLLYVDCFSHSGRRQNHKFTIVYARNNNLMGLNGKTDANGYASRAGKALYQPSPQFDSHRRARITSVLIQKGFYEVLLAGSKGPGPRMSGNVQITPVGTSYRHCQPVEWENSFTPLVFVNCTTGAGKPADVKFTLQWVDIKP